MTLPGLGLGSRVLSGPHTELEGLIWSTRGSRQWTTTQTHWGRFPVSGLCRGCRRRVPVCTRMYSSPPSGGVPTCAHVHVHVYVVVNTHVHLHTRVSLSSDIYLNTCMRRNHAYSYVHSHTPVIHTYTHVCASLNGRITRPYTPVHICRPNPSTSTCPSTLIQLCELMCIRV